MMISYITLIFAALYESLCVLTFRLCRYGSAVTASGDIRTSTNEAYEKVGGGEREEGYELVDISHGDPSPPPAKLEEMYEVPSSSAPTPSQPLPTIPLPHTDADTEEKDTPVYDVIPGDM